MSMSKRRAKTLALSSLAIILCVMLSLSLFACGQDTSPAQQDDTAAITSSSEMLEGDITGVVGTEYETKWFTFTIDSLSSASSYGDYTAADGNLLAVAHITETNTSSDQQHFGTFDWFVDDGSFENLYYPLDPLNDTMMPASFVLEAGETASYDVVIEYPLELAAPSLMYVEADDQGGIYVTFKVPLS